MHFWLIQAKWLGHSLLLIHSGLQFGGDPTNSGRQEQDGCPFISLHWEFGPHGDGLQGFFTSTGSSSGIFQINRLSVVQTFLKLTYRDTSDERITSKPRSTTTNWIVVNHLTISINSAGSRTRINAFLVYTSLT